MYVEFDTLNDSSRVWVYQSSRQLSAEEIATMEGGIKRFCESVDKARRQPEGIFRNKI